MKDAQRLIGQVQGLLENSSDAVSLKTAVLRLAGALEDALKEIASLHQEIDELNEYVSRIDDDLGELELMHDDEAEDYEDYFGLDVDEDEDDEFDDEDDEEDEDEEDEEDDEDEGDGKATRTVFRIWHGDDKKDDPE